MKRFILAALVAVVLSVCASATVPTVTVTFTVADPGTTPPATAPTAYATVTWSATPSPSYLNHPAAPTYSATTGILTWTLPANCQVKFQIPETYPAINATYALGTGSAYSLNDLKPVTLPATAPPWFTAGMADLMPKSGGAFTGLFTLPKYTTLAPPTMTATGQLWYNTANDGVYVSTPGSPYYKSRLADEDYINGQGFITSESDPRLPDASTTGNVLTSNGSAWTSAAPSFATLLGNANTWTAAQTVQGHLLGTGAGNVATNVVYGAGALAANTTGNTSIAIGTNALAANVDGHSNTAVGWTALASANASGNTAIGADAMTGATSAEHSTAVGCHALDHTVGGNTNDAFGYSTLVTNVSGHDNAAFAAQALALHVDGYYNVAVGGQSQYNNLHAARSTAVGYQSFYSGLTSDSTAVGYQSLYSLSTGSYCTALGSMAGTYIANGSTPNATSTTSTYLGKDTKALADGDTNETVIGEGAIGAGSNSATLGNTSVTSTVLRGAVSGPTSVTADPGAQAATAIPADAIAAVSATPALVGAKVQESPAIRIEAHGWTAGGADMKHNWRLYVVPNADASTSTFKLGYQQNGGAEVFPLLVTPTSLTALEGVNIDAGAYPVMYLKAGGALKWGIFSELYDAGALSFHSYVGGGERLRLTSAGVLTVASVSCSPTISSGTSAPATTPAKVGDMFVDTTGKKLYFATGTASSTDWTIVN